MVFHRAAPSLALRLILGLITLVGTGLAITRCTTEPGRAVVDAAPQDGSPRELDTQRTLRRAARSLEAPGLAVQQVRFEDVLKDLPSSPVPERLRLVWISLDGLQRSLLQGFLTRIEAQPGGRASLHPFGIRYLLAQKKKAWSDLRVTDPTITASSHVSTMTCLPPGAHGIIANSQWNGSATESGFEKVYPSETFVDALRAKGLHVSVVGYPGFDGRAPNRVADTSVSYARTNGKSQFIDVVPGTDVSLDLSAFFAAGQTDGQTPTAPKLSFLLDPSQDGGTLWQVAADGQRSALGQVNSDRWTELLFDARQGAADPTSTSPGPRRQLIGARLFPRPQAAASSSGSEKRMVLYLSAASSNLVRPESLAKDFDDRGLVFPAGKDFRALKDLGDDAFLATLESNLRYFGLSAHRALSVADNDAVFLYFESLDVLGHQYAGAQDKLAVVDRHLRNFDQMLGSLLERIGTRANVVMAGDHGMSAIQFELNALELIPAGIRSQIQVRSSGGSLFIYGADAASLTSLPPSDQAWFQDLVSKLTQARLPGRPEQPILTHVWVKGTPETVAAGWRKETPLPWIIATAQTGIGLVTSVEPGLLQSLRRGAVVPAELLALSARPKDPATGQPAALPEPVPLGQHGHASEDPQMLTHVIAFGPDLDGHLGGAARTSAGSSTPAGGAPTLRNIELVPRVADLLQWPRPKGCAAP